MECRTCGTELPANAAYCFLCGDPTRCGACGSSLPFAAVYCPGCGIPLDAPDDAPDDYRDGFSYASWDDDPADLWNGPVEDWESAKAAGTWPPASVAPSAPPPAPLPPYQRSLGIHREGPLGKLATLLSWPAAAASIYLAVMLWGEDREQAWRVLGAMALYALSPVHVGLVLLPLSLVIGFANRRRSDVARGRFGVVWRAVFDGLANLVSLAALVFIFVQLWETVQ